MAIHPTSLEEKALFFGMETIERADCGGPCRRKDVPVVVFAINPDTRNRGFGTGRLCSNCLVDLANEVAFSGV